MTREAFEAWAHATFKQEAWRVISPTHCAWDAWQSAYQAGMLRAAEIAQTQVGDAELLAVCKGVAAAIRAEAQGER